MTFECLDRESENLLIKLLNKGSVIDENVSGTSIEFLVNQGYVNGKNCRTLSDKEPKYVLTGITQKGKSYFELKDKYEKEKKRLSHREWKIAIISAIIGALIGLIPYAVQFLL